MVRGISRVFPVLCRCDAARAEPGSVPWQCSEEGEEMIGKVSSLYKNRKPSDVRCTPCLPCGLV